MFLLFSFQINRQRPDLAQNLNARIASLKGAFYLMITRMSNAPNIDSPYPSRLGAVNDALEAMLLGRFPGLHAICFYNANV